MIDLKFRPIDKPIAPPKAGARRAPFKIAFGRLLDDLERELGHLKATDIIVEAALDLADIRNDGWPRSSARPRTPGLRLSFTSKHGPLSYECATYTEWEGNLRAISLTLESLRAVDRYGAVKGGEQYKGWARLPEKAGGESVREAMGTIHALAGWATTDVAIDESLKSRDNLTRARNAAMRLNHPDTNPDKPDAAANTQLIQRAFETIVAVKGADWGLR